MLLTSVRPAPQNLGDEKDRMNFEVTRPPELHRNRGFHWLRVALLEKQNSQPI
jgi:hypothetical protein